MAGVLYWSCCFCYPACVIPGESTVAGRDKRRAAHPGPFESLEFQTHRAGCCCSQLHGTYSTAAHKPTTELLLKEQFIKNRADIHTRFFYMLSVGIPVSETDVQNTLGTNTFYVCLLCKDCLNGYIHF